MSKLETIFKEALQDFEVVLKGTIGKHWHWHGNKGSSIAVEHGKANGYTHNGSNAEVSRFVKPSTLPQNENIHQLGLHQTLMNNGFKLDSTKVDDLPWRKSVELKYSHPDGTQVESVSNEAKDNSTESAHGFSVYHTAASNTPAAAPPAKSPATAPLAAQGTNYTDHLNVAANILAQYGGNKFRAMTGAHSFTASKEKGGALTMKIPKTYGATKGVKYVKTVHDPATDTYDVHFMGRTGDTKHLSTGIHASELQSHFKHHTGLDTHL